MRVRSYFIGSIEQMWWVADGTCTKPETVFIGGNNKRWASGRYVTLLPSNATAIRQNTEIAEPGEEPYPVGLPAVFEDISASP